MRAICCQNTICAKSATYSSTNNRACYSLAELDDADMDFGQVQALRDANWIVAPQRPYQRYAYEETLRALVAKQAVPHNGINYEPYFVGAKLAR